jgi:voltage-gated potassium channel
VAVSLRSLIEAYREYRFQVLLAILVLYIVVSMLLEGSRYEALLRTTLVSFVLLAAMGCLRSRRKKSTLSLWLGVATLIGGWVTVDTGFPGLMILSTGFRIVFFLVVTGTLIFQVATSAEVSLRVIIGAIDGYLLLGMMGGGALSIVEIASPGSFNAAGSTLAHPDLLYYAFITMTTVGYGDISPVAPAARSVAVLLAVAGQLYIAVLMALLVGKYIGSKQ